MSNALNFQDLILQLQKYWMTQGCAILQPYDLEMGAGTFHPATTLRALDNKPWRTAYVQPSRRPTDGRYGKNPNRLYRFNQFQVLLKPSPDNVLDLYFNSLEAIGISRKNHDIRIVEDDWENPTIGAWGLGWEVWIDGMEVTQFTYMQQIGGIELPIIPAEITYGLERIAMYIQDVEDVYQLKYNDQYSYGEIHQQYEADMTSYCLDEANTEFLLQGFINCENECKNLIDKCLPYAAYEQCIKASNFFNILDARGVISVTDRASYIGRVRDLAKLCCECYKTKMNMTNV
jgi:glycyl-tRNA synthetase alpha chain